MNQSYENKVENQSYENQSYENQSYENLFSKLQI